MKRLIVELCDGVITKDVTKCSSPSVHWYCNYDVLT